MTSSSMNDFYIIVISCTGEADDDVWDLHVIPGCTSAI